MLGRVGFVFLLIFSLLWNASAVSASETCESNYQEISDKPDGAPFLLRAPYYWMLFPSHLYREVSSERAQGRSGLRGVAQVIRKDYREMLGFGLMLLLSRASTSDVFDLINSEDEKLSEAENILIVEVIGEGQALRGMGRFYAGALQGEYAQAKVYYLAVDDIEKLGPALERAADERGSFDAIGLLAHGRYGKITLGKKALSVDEISEKLPKLSGKVSKPGAVLFGIHCQSGNGEAGKELGQVLGDRILTNGGTVVMSKNILKGRLSHVVAAKTGIGFQSSIVDLVDEAFIGPLYSIHGLLHFSTLPEEPFPLWNPVQKIPISGKEE